MPIGGLGSDFGRMWGRRGASAVDPLKPTAPVLTWTSAETIDPPEFDIVIDNTVTAGDDFELQYDSDSGFSAPTTVSGTVSAADVSGLAIIIGDDEAALSAFGDGTWYVRVRVGPTGHLSNWSNTETVTIAVPSAATQYSIGNENGVSFISESGGLSYMTPSGYLNEAA